MKLSVLSSSNGTQRRSLNASCLTRASSKRQKTPLEGEERTSQACKIMADSNTSRYDIEMERGNIMIVGTATGSRGGSA
jgi:hypothetical protein